MWAGESMQDVFASKEAWSWFAALALVGRLLGISLVKWRVEHAPLHLKD